MKLRYVNRKESYDEWATVLWSRGFDYPVKEACRYLHVTERWFREEILKKINYVVYRSPWLYKKIKSYENGLTYINKEELSAWIKNNAMYQKQTEYVDLYSYLALADKKKANAVLSSYNELFERLKDYYRKGTIPKKIMNQIRQEFNLSSDILQNVNVKDRRRYMWMDTESQNLFDEDIYFADQFRNDETCYRNVFLNGDTKVTIGKGKTVFIKSKTNIDKMKMPYLVKAYANIIVK